MELKERLVGGASGAQSGTWLRNWKCCDVSSADYPETSALLELSPTLLQHLKQKHNSRKRIKRIKLYNSNLTGRNKTQNKKMPRWSSAPAQLHPLESERNQYLSLSCYGNHLASSAPPSRSGAQRIRDGHLKPVGIERPNRQAQQCRRCPRRSFFLPCQDLAISPTHKWTGELLIKSTAASAPWQLVCCCRGCRIAPGFINDSNSIKGECISDIVVPHRLLCRQRHHRQKKGEVFLLFFSFSLSFWLPNVIPLA